MSPTWISLCRSGEVACLVKNPSHCCTGARDCFLLARMPLAWYLGNIDSISVPGLVNPDPNAKPNPPSGPNDTSDSPLTGAIVGGIAGAIALGALIFLFVKRRRVIENRNTAAATAAAHKPQPKVSQGNNNNNAYLQQPGPDVGPDYYNPAGKNPVTNYLGGPAAPTVILPMAPITPVPLPSQQQQQQQQHQQPQPPPPPQQQQQRTMQEEMQALQQQMQALQSRMEASQVSPFSTHPRPNVTTSYGREPAPANTAGAPHAPWQPMPFVPPVRPASNGTSSSAGSSPAATTAHSSQDLQAIASQVVVDSPALSASTPLSSTPSIPRITRLNPEIGSPHALTTSQNHPHT